MFVHINLMLPPTNPTITEKQIEDFINVAEAFAGHELTRKELKDTLKENFGVKGKESS